MKTLNVKPMANGRIRFNVLNRDGFVAVRKRKARWGLQRGKAFLQVHVGKYSVAIEHNAPHKPLWDWAA